MIHCRDGTHNWEVFHRSLGANWPINLNSPNTARNDSTVWNNTSPTSSVFTVGTSSNVNQNGHGYVAYVFAHDDQSFGADQDEAIIKCGYYAGTGASQEINLGFEAQWLLVRNNSGATNWFMVNNMMGDKSVVADESSAEVDNSYGFDGFRANGFALTGGNANFNSNGSAYIYMAIRRPHKPPTAGTEVFAAQASRSAADGTPSELTYTSNFPVDLMFNLGRAGNSLNMVTVDRLRGQSAYLATSQTNAENTSGPWKLDTNAGVYLNGNFGATSDHGGLMFRRAPGFFDVVAYTGTGSAASFSHNLKATPQLLIHKSREATNSWVVFTTVIDGTMDYTYLNGQNQTGNSSSGLPTSSVFNVSSGAIINASGGTFIAYLFATLDGISKVGTYSGTGNDINVDCGFTAGARFVLIKRTDSSGDWYIWDTARGIVSGNDPYLLLNSTAAEVTNTDYIDPLNAGFTVTSSAPSALNTSGGTYLFLAIA